MKRRSFIRSLLAVPVVAAVAKFVPASTEPPYPAVYDTRKPNKWRERYFNPFKPCPRCDRAICAGCEGDLYCVCVAGESIRKGQLLTNGPMPTVVVLIDRTKGCIGMALNDAAKGDSVRVFDGPSVHANLYAFPPRAYYIP